MSRKLILFIGIALLLVGGVSYFYFRKNSQIPTVRAELGKIEEKVEVVGKVTSATNVDLGFESPGKISRAYVSVGDTVKEGDPLIALDQRELRATLNSAKANLQKSLVEYNSLKGSSATSYNLSVNGLSESLHEAYAQADDAVRNYTDQFFTNPRSSNAFFDPSFTDGGYTYLSNIPDTTKRSLSDERIALEKLLNEWEEEVNALGTTKSDLDRAYTYSRTNLLKVQNFLDNIALAINSITTENFTYRTTINGYKTTISNARAKISAALSDIASAQSSYNAGPVLQNGNYDKVLAQEAYIQSLRENINALEADLEKGTLTSPISGTVTRADGKKGESVGAGATLVSILSEHQKQVEAQVSELNIGRVETGNIVEISFEAFPEETYHGKVIYVDPGEVIVDKIPTYKVTVEFTDPLPERVRSGFTANLDILTATKDNVVKVPGYTLSRDSDGYKAKIKGKGGTNIRKVEIGLRGQDGSVEIVRGIDVGEEILTK